MKSEKIVFLQYPNRIVVCESVESSLGKDPETCDSYEYACIVRFCQPTNILETEYEFTGDIKWSKHKDMLTPEHKREVEDFAAKMREEAAEQILRAKAQEARNKKLWPKYA